MQIDNTGDVWNIFNCCFLISNLYVSIFSSYLEIMIGGPQPAGGMEGLKDQLKGKPESAADPNGTTDQATDGDDAEKGN
jgi:hypothetical protein